MVHKNQVIEIIKCLDSYMNKTDIKEIGAPEANEVLEKAGILSDSKTRPGLPLRRKLRGGMLPHAYKKGSEWIIPISDGKTQKCEVSLPVSKTKSSISNPKEQQTTMSSISFDKFCTIDSIPLDELDDCGFYCIRLMENKVLPNEKYQKHLRSNRLIYIGKAEGQTLKKRFYDQELNAVGHGTFFRSIGAVLKFTPPKGSLVNKANQNNYTFSEEDTKEIIKWMKENFEVSWVIFNGDFSIENQIIKANLPLLNLNHNPKKLRELEEDRELCRRIACSPT